MIGVVAKKRRDGGSSVHYLISYVSKKTKTKINDHLMAIWYRNIWGENTRDAVVEMRNLIDMNRRCRIPLSHFIVSWPQGEIPTLEQVEEVGDYVLKELGGEENQAVFALHQNTDNYHLHIVVNRAIGCNKVVRLAGGWPVPALQKACRELELKYGWAVQHGGLWDVIDGQVVYTGKRASISKKAKDFETFTGEVSEERKLKKVCGGIFTNTHSWDETHKLLAEYGIRLKPKGSGGILEINGIAVKLSRIGREFTWKQLIKKYGDFKEAGEEIKNLLEGIKTGKKGRAQEKEDLVGKGQPILSTGSWEDYHKERTAYFAERRMYANDRLEAKKSIRDKIKADYQKMMNDFRGERFALNMTPMMGKEKNLMRKRVAFSQAQRFAVLRSDVRLERKAWEMSWPHTPGGRFPSYKEWLVAGNLKNEWMAWVNRRKMGLIWSGGQQGEDDPAEEMIWRLVPVIVNFQIAKSDQSGHICYEIRRAGRTDGETAFVDYGRAIKIFEENEESLLVAMQLGMAKWGAIKITGDVEFQNKCFEVALQYGLKVKNPEFETLKKLKTEKEETSKTKEFGFYPILNTLSKKLNTEYGDPKLSGGVHAHRVPGTRNPKPKYQRVDGSFPLVSIVKAERKICSKTLLEAEGILTRLRAENEESRARLREFARSREMMEKFESQLQGKKDTGKAYLVHLNDLKSRYTDGNIFKMDVMACLRLRATGHDREDIKNTLRVLGQEEWKEYGKKRNMNVETYISHTVDDYVFGPKGDLEISKWLHLLGRWFEIENAENRKTAEKDKQRKTGVMPQVPEWIVTVTKEGGSAAFDKRNYLLSKELQETPRGEMPEIPDWLKEVQGKGEVKTEHGETLTLTTPEAAPMENTKNNPKHKDDLKLVM